MRLHNKKLFGKVMMTALVGVVAGSMLAPSAGSTSLSYIGESSLAGIAVTLDSYAEKSGADEENILVAMGIEEAVTEEKAEAAASVERSVAGLSLDDVEAFAQANPAETVKASAETELEQPAKTEEPEIAEAAAASAATGGEAGAQAAMTVEDDTTEPAELPQDGNTDEVVQASSEEPAAAEEPEKTEEPETKEVETEAEVSKYANLGISIASNYVNIRQEPNTDCEVVGKLYNGAAATICGYEGEWVLIESGHCQGYIKAEYLAIGEEAEKVATDYGNEIAYIKADGLRVREDKSTDSAVLAVVYSNEKYQVLAESDEWAKIRVDDSTKGWVYKEFIETDVIFEKGITIEEEQEKIRKEEEARKKAEEEARKKAEEEARKKAEEAAKKKAEEEAAKKKAEEAAKKSSSSSKSKSDSSSKSKSDSSSKANEGGDGGSYDASKGAQIVAYAKQFVGNPYVYGGTSLTNGCDCSGFTMKVMEHFGISLPRSSYDQQFAGTAVSLSNLQPGDLILYAKNGRVNHVTIYIGGGQVVHASSPSVGIIISNMNYRTPYCARRVVH